MMLPPSAKRFSLSSPAYKFKNQPQFGRMAVRDSSQPEPYIWQRDAYKRSQSTKAHNGQISADKIYNASDEDSLVKTKDQIDHEAPRGFKMGTPVLAEDTGEVLGNIGLDLYRLAALPITGPYKLGKWGVDKSHEYYRKKHPLPQVVVDRREAQKQQKALKLISQIANRVNLKDLQNEEGEPIPELDAKARLFVVLTQHPEFMEQADFAVGNPSKNVAKRAGSKVYDFGRWLYMAAPHLPTLVDKLVNLDFSEADATQLPAGQSVEMKSPGSENPIISRARQLTLDLGHSEAKSVAHELEVSGSWSAVAGRGVSKGFRAFKPFQQRDMSQASFARYIKEGKLPPTKNPHRFAVVNKQDSSLTVYPNGVWQRIKNIATWSNPKPLVDHRMPLQVHTSNANIKMLLGVMTRGMEAKDIPDFDPDTVMSVKVRNNKKFKEKVLQPLVNTFRVTDKVKLANGKMVEIKEACLWPFIEAILTEGEQGLGPNCTVKGDESKKCFDLLADSKVFKFKASDKKLEKFLNERLQDKNDPVMRELRAKLAVIQVASLQYAEQVDLKETIAAFAKGAIVGTVGETIVEKAIPHPKEGKFLMTQPSYWANWALMSLVDAYDNWQGEQGSLEADLKGMGLKNNPKDVFGQDQKPTIRQRLSLLFKRDAPGPAGMSVGTAQFSAMQGALLGGLVSLGTAFPFTNKHTPDWELALASGATALGTAFSIPLSYGYTKPRVMLSYNEALKTGRLKLPQHILDIKDEKKQKKAIQEHIEHTATQDMMARIGLQASAKAYTVVAPAMASLWALRAAGVSRETVQALAFGLTPGAENASRGLLTTAKLKKIPIAYQVNPWYQTFQDTIDDTERMTLLSMLQGNEHAAPYRDQIRSSFSDSWSRGSAWIMNKMTTWLPLPVPIQPVLTNRYKIDYVKPKDMESGFSKSPSKLQEPETAITREQVGLRNRGTDGIE